MKYLHINNNQIGIINITKIKKKNQLTISVSSIINRSERNIDFFCFHLGCDMRYLYLKKKTTGVGSWG